MPYVAMPELRLYYEEHGVAGGPPLVLLHGFTSSGPFWEPQLAAFGAQYRLIVPDLRGHGRSNNPGGLPAMNHHQFALDVIALCRELDLQHPIFCGESTGAMLQLWLALEAPELPRAHVLAGGTYFYGPELHEWWRTQTPETLAGERVEELAARHTALGPEHWRTVLTAFIALGEHDHAADFPEADALSGVRAPTLIVHGDRDFFFPPTVPTELYRLLPDAELCIFPNTGHTPPAERPAWFNEVVLEFLSRRLPATAAQS